MGYYTILLDVGIDMTFSKFLLAVLISGLLLVPAKIARANPSQEAAATDDVVVLEFAGSALWNTVYFCDAVGDYVFLTMDFGLMIVDVSDKTHPQAVSRIYMPSGTNRLQVVGDYAYVCGGGDLNTGKNWATLTIVDISDVYNPQIVGCYQSPDSVIGSGVKVVGDYVNLPRFSGHIEKIVFNSMRRCVYVEEASTV